MADLTRRQMLLAGVLGAAATALPAPRALAGSVTPAGSTSTVTLTGSAFGTGSYDYHQFTMLPGVNRLDVALRKVNPPTDNNVGIGIFDQRGAHYATKDSPNGFRGIFGQERSTFTITPAEATNAFIPGPLTPGTWTVIVPVFMVGPTPMTYEVVVTMTYGDAPQAFVLGREVDLVNASPGWYRGDLHCHTQASSDALSSGSAMLPAEWARTCRAIGLDYVALTDHNVVSQNFALEAAAADTGVLVMAGEEMTNWFWGHATVSGLSPGDWVDWRQLPAQQYSAAAKADPTIGTIQEMIAHARALGAFVAAAHPLGATLAWRFFPDAAADPAARTDSLEVWTGPFQPDDQATVTLWDQQLVAGQRVVANGGSDLHGVANTGGVAAGSPTTVVHADALSKRQVIAALKAGRSFITRTPLGAEVYLAVSNPNGAQRQIMGGTVYGTPTDTVTVTIDVRRAAGLRLVLIRDGQVVSTTPLVDPAQQVVTTMPLAAAGYLRAELRGQPSIDAANPTASRLDMEAMTNPVWLALGPPPPGTVADRTQPPAPDGASTPVLPEVGVATLLPAAGVAVGAYALHRRRRPTGPVAMTHTEFGMRASDPAWTDPVVLTGEVTAVADGVAVLSRWVPGCCSMDARVDVVVTGAVEGLEPGRWWSVTGRAERPAAVPQLPGADHGHGETSVAPLGLRAGSATVVADPPARREV